MGSREVAERRPIRSAPVPDCPLCGAAGVPAYRSVVDRLFGVPGEWSFRRCGSAVCGLLWLDPMPLNEDLPSLYQEYFTHQTGAVRGRGLRARLEQWLRRGVLQVRLGYDQGLSQVVAWALCGLARVSPSGADGFMSQAMFLGAPDRGRRLLEVGCGSGEALAHMRSLGWTVLGTDFDPAAVAVARARGLEVRLGGAESVEREERPFDAVYLGHVIEHVPDPLDLLRRCRDLLREGGVLVLVTPNTAGLGSTWFGRHWRGLEPPRHLHAFNVSCLATSCARAGLSVRTLRTTAKGARYILGGSLWIRSAAASSTVDDSRGGVVIRVAALLLQLLERIIVPVCPDAGEEIILIAARAPDGAMPD